MIPSSGQAVHAGWGGVGTNPLYWVVGERWQDATPQRGIAPAVALEQAQQLLSRHVLDGAGTSSPASRPISRDIR